MKTCKKNMAIVLSLVLAAASIAMPSTDSKAAKMKLNKSSVTVAVGKKVSLKVKGTTKKVSWTTSKKAIASVSKKGVVTGKKAGIVTITAKVGAKKFRCKVTVKKSSKVKTLSTTTLASKCSFSVKKFKKGVLLSVKNNSSQSIDEVNANYVLKTASGVTVDTGNFTFYYLAAGKSLDKSIYLTNDQLGSIDTSKAVVSCTVSQNYNEYHYVNMKKYVSDSLAETTSADQLNYTLKNTSSKKIEVYACVYFYDNSGNLVDVDWNTIYLEPKETKFKTIYAPYEYNDNADLIKGYASYKLTTNVYGYKK